MSNTPTRKDFEGDPGPDLSAARGVLNGLMLSLAAYAAGGSVLLWIW